jgi:hypothetical protein
MADDKTRAAQRVGLGKNLGQKDDLRVEEKPDPKEAAGEATRPEATAHQQSRRQGGGAAECDHSLKG